MSRMKEFRKTIFLGMTDKGEEVLLPEKAYWGIYEREHIKRISPPYAVQAGLDTVLNLNPRKPRKKTTKAPALTDLASIPKGLANMPPVKPQKTKTYPYTPLGHDNAASEAVGVNLPIPKAKTRKTRVKKGEKPKLASFHCTSCGKEVDNPDALIRHGKQQCPKCRRLETIVANE